MRAPSPKRPKLSAQLLKQPTTEALNMAIQSILPSSSNTQSPPKTKEIVSPSPASSPITTPPQLISNYQIVTNPSKISVTSRPTTVQSGTMPKPTTTTTVTPKQTPSTLTFGQKAVQKIKLMSPNQIAPLKQQSTATTTGISKQFILKSTTNPTKMNIVTPSQTIRSQPTNKMFTVKTIPASSITALKPQVTAIVTQSTISSTLQSAGTTPLNISPPKFTIMKPNVLSPIVKIAPILRTATQSQPLPVTITTTIAGAKSTIPDLSTTNIFDIPIVFADNDGNIQDSSGLTTTIPPVTNTMPIVLPASAIDRNVSQLVQNRNIVINSITVPNRAAGTNKVMLINRTQARPIPNILSRAVPPLKYTKVMVSSPNILSSNLAKPIQQTIGKPTIKLNTTGGKFEILSNALIKAPSNATGTSIAISGGSVVTSMVTAVSSSPIVSTIGKFQPIVINVDSDKTTIKNMINVVSQPQTLTTTTMPIRKPNTIVIKPGGLKPITSLNTNLLNKNVTVRKVYNIVPHRLGQLVTTTTSAGQLTGQIQLQPQLSKPTSTLTVTTGPATIISTQANVPTTATINSTPN